MRLYILSSDMNTKTRIIINTVKYLKKIIKRISKEELQNNPEQKEKLYFQYNELVDLIVDQMS